MFLKVYLSLNMTKHSNDQLKHTKLLFKFLPKVCQRNVVAL